MTLLFLLLDLSALVVAAAVGAVFILTSAGVLSLSAVGDFADSGSGVAVMALAGALLLLVGLHFVVLIWRWRSAASRFSQDGEWGTIELSPHALREFISGILREEVGIDRFRVRLRHAEEGIAISVKTALSTSEKVSEVGRSIQKILAQRVAERTGVHVGRVSVLVHSIRSREEGIPGSTEEEGDASGDER